MQSVMENKYARGSVWRKWDLHVHTPFSLNQEYGGNTDQVWEKFIQDLESLPEEFKVIGVNDYIFLDGYKKVIEYKKQGRLSNLDLLLPVVELRIDKYGNVNNNDAWKRVNFHVIFSNEVTAEQIEQQFLSAISHSHTLSPEHNSSDFSGVITRDSLADFGKKIKESSSITIPGSDISIGFNNITYGYDKVKSVLSSCTYFKDKFITAVGKTEWDALRWDGSIADKKSVINEADFVFISSESPEKLEVSKNKLIEQNVNSNLIDCSDSHHFANAIDSNSKPIKDRIGKCYTWIKADPTFEGLKQVIYEPEERLRIQANNPEYDFDKPYFEKISINGEVSVYNGQSLKIAKNEIVLNKNLVSIIGGRGEGKSTIINYLGHALNKIESDQLLTSDENFQIEHHKINDLEISDTDKKLFKSSDRKENQLSFVFIRQGELKEKTKDSLSDTLKKMLRLTETGFSKPLTTEISTVNNEIDSIERWKLDKNENGDLVNSIAFHEEIIRINKVLLDNLKNSKNKENIELYNNNLSDISASKKVISISDSILSKTKDYLEDIDRLISTSGIVGVFSKPDLNVYQNDIKQIKEAQNATIEKKTVENQAIKDSLLNNGVSGDLTTLLENTTKFQNIITDSENSIIEIQAKEKRLIELRKTRSGFGEKIKNDYGRQVSEVNQGWDNFLSNHTPKNKELITKILLSDNKLVVNGELNFDVDEFYKNLSDSLNKNTFKDINDLRQSYNITDINTWSDFIKNEFNDKYDSLNHKKQEFIDLFFSTEKRSKYIKSEAKIRYDSKDLSQLSAGQKGTAYLRIQLANSAFAEPIIFDQPEDDLDNKFIVNELITIFKELKKFRQIIIVTHNANLVVNADAEQIIVAKNDNESLSYITGSLENKEIQKYVCDILEGGKDAFEKRQKKYNMR